MRQRMARRFVENVHASSSMVNSPRIPVNRPKTYSLSRGAKMLLQVLKLSCVIDTDYFTDKRLTLIGLIVDADC